MLRVPTWAKEQIRKGMIENLQSQIKSLRKEHSQYAEATDAESLLVRDMIGAKIVDLEAQIKSLKETSK